MTYTPIKPDSGPSPKDDAPFIRANFAQFASIFASTSLGIRYNHTPLNDRNQGDHEVVLFEKQLIDPVVDQDMSTLYCKDSLSNISTEPQLFVRLKKFLPTNLDPKNAENTPIQLTYNQVNTAGPVYQSFLAGGYLIYFGQTNDITVNITVSPAPTKLLLAIACPFNVGSANRAFDVTTRLLTNTTFKINSIAATPAYIFAWVAIGTV